MRICKQVKRFDSQRNIFSIAEELQDYLHESHTSYFLLTRQGGRFGGIVSTKDLLIYLSNITRTDISLARTLQERMMGRVRAVDENGVRVHFCSRMAKGVGGDYSFVKRTGEHTLTAALCDVSGKGISASLVTSMLGGMFNLYDFSAGLPELIRKMNRYISSAFEGEKYLTAVFLEYNTRTREAVVYDMGHSLLFLMRDSSFFRIRTSEENLPIGLVPDGQVKADRVVLRDEDILVLLTDGVNEQINESGKEFGMARVGGVLQKNRDSGFPAAVDALFSSVYAFRGGQPQHDDMSVMLLGPRR